MQGRRLKSTVILVGLAVSGLTIVAWTQPWFDVALVDGEARGSSISVGGDIAAGGLAALGLAGLALMGALSIAGRVFRTILAVLEFLIGAVVALSGITALTDPVSASTNAVTEATGVSGAESVAALVAATTPTVWPAGSIVLGAASAAIAVAILLTGPRWPTPTRKYQAARFDEVDEADESADPAGDAVFDWDTLTEGGDPTRRAERRPDPSEGDSPAR